MAEEVVVTTFLSPEMIEAGQRLLQALDEDGFDAHAAYWLYLDEPDIWRLRIASPGVAEGGTRKFYERVQSVIFGMKAAPRIQLQDVSVIDVDHPEVAALRNAFQMNEDVAGKRLFRYAIDGQRFEDVYIYRL